ncbi:heparinase II/III-family protein [Bdellovibrio bacteriovorus]|uniref:heparinase II/III family protein n=1 Tax=Bdellovibrio bacteriovorus TaxID=959 RepID=UPI003A7FBF45
MSGFFVKLRTAFLLGLVNILRVLVYRASIRFGLSSICKLSVSSPAGVFYRESYRPESVLRPSQAWISKGVKYFGYHQVHFDEAPDWLLNPMTGVRFPHSEREWWTIPDFDNPAGDIKAYWEASRFEWVISHAQHAKNGDPVALAQLNAWVNSWLKSNPPYLGPNWKCGQESSLRVLHLITGCLILDQLHEGTENLQKLIELHLQRIFPTVSYAVAQDNNHGTSEAAALFVGGSWLAMQGAAVGKKWAKAGRSLLENRVLYLVEDDGTFSQYSLNYHRMMLDTLSIVEVVRRRLDLKPFSGKYYSRARAASNWLYTFIDPKTGDGPNLGANDGSRILPLTDTDYRDFRPSVQLASVLFESKWAYKGLESADLPLSWLGVQLPKEGRKPPVSTLFDKGGFAVLIRDRVKAFLRYPRFKFRPSHSDLLHVDLWVDGVNVLQDAGTYSYNVEAKWLDYFPGTESHNTVQFDGRDQMPRLSRFLFGGWLKPSFLKPIENGADGEAVAVGYRDASGAVHLREICLNDGLLRIQDRIEGFKDKAVLRWRLPEGNWEVQGHLLVNGNISLKVTGSMSIERFELVDGWRSLYYQSKDVCPVLEVEVSSGGILCTEVCWSI